MQERKSMNQQQRAIKDMAAALAYAEEILPNDVVVMNGAAVGRWLLEQPEPVPLTDDQIETIIKSNMSLQMNLAGIRQDFEAAYTTPPAQPEPVQDSNVGGCAMCGAAYEDQVIKQPVQKPEPACWQGEDCCPNRNACCDAQHCLYTITPAHGPYSAPIKHLWPVAQPAEPDYKQLYEQLCEQYDVLVNELKGTQPTSWVGLTQREWDDLWDEHHDDYGYQLSVDGYERAIEQRLKEKNGGAV
jgi:hypothetical protein